MNHKLEDRIHYVLPLNHSDFENIRSNICICENNETVDMYRKSNDGLSIQVKCHIEDQIPSMNDLEVIDENDPNWIDLNVLEI